MKSNNSIFNLINESTITIFGYSSFDEYNMLSFFDILCYREPDNTVRIYSHSVPNSKKLKNESYSVNTTNEIYEIISTLKNKTIIIDTLSEFAMSKAKSISRPTSNEVLQRIRTLCIENDCLLVIGNHTYNRLSNIAGSPQVMVGGNSMLYLPDNVFMVNDGILNCIKSRSVDVNDFKDINLKAYYLREETLRMLLD